MGVSKSGVLKGPLEGLSTDLPLKCNCIEREGRRHRPLPGLRRARRLEGRTRAYKIFRGDCLLKKRICDKSFSAHRTKPAPRSHDRPGRNWPS